MSIMASLPEQPGSDEAVTLGVLGDLTGYHLRRASGAVAADFRRALDGTGMRQVLFGILSVVADNPGINQGAVGRVLGIQRANMVALINELVDAGSIDRRAAANDRRAFSLALTPAGVSAMRECAHRIAAHEEAMLADLSAAERRVLIEMLGRIEARGGA
ncbi:MarR family winged helix-turn-helix transcriptional regulator [Sphingomonas bacterium]|uniref:MarR family winged helix-turn-helix transcriptional regulator n=1 Tax=Sphingomonas bacterium TaxID=1895847 RepID=UPI0020C6902F|nr:MarR family winged helix-turn-helix transcriptional regulator [Sphingomonas bacterium]